MKNAIILHGTNANSKLHWFPWLKEQLEKEGYIVWLPDLPRADRPNIERYNQFLLNHKVMVGGYEKSWEFNDDTILVGHSSGAVEILGLLKALPEDVKVRACIMIGAFKDDLGWDSLSELFITPFNFELIKQRCDKFIFIHSDNDPYCPLEHAQNLAKQLSGELIVLPGQGHFSAEESDPAYKDFPKLLEIINELDR